MSRRADETGGAPDGAAGGRPPERNPGPPAGTGEPTEAAVLAETRDLVGVARINRPEARNALSPDVMEMLAQLVEAWDADPAVSCIVIAGGDEFFAAGADIGELRDRAFHDTLVAPSARFWPRVAACRTPIVAAVSGYALGGGCELALLCDLIVASRTAEFGQPEIMLGIIPGGGGTQRLARTVGKQRAMEIVLTGRRITADEAYGLGLVNRVTEPGEWLDEAVDVAQVIARRAPIAARLAKQAVLAAFETGLSAGLDQERRLFELAMATEDRVEGTTAFLEKRRPEFRGR
jgi:enoyl-CoA hydratase/carnithine racemase